MKNSKALSMFGALCGAVWFFWICVIKGGLEQYGSNPASRQGSLRSKVAAGYDLRNYGNGIDDGGMLARKWTKAERAWRHPGSERLLLPQERQDMTERDHTVNRPTEAAKFEQIEKVDNYSSSSKPLLVEKNWSEGITPNKSSRRNESTQINTTTDQTGAILNSKHAIDDVNKSNPMGYPVPDGPSEDENKRVLIANPEHTERLQIGRHGNASSPSSCPPEFTLSGKAMHRYGKVAQISNFPDRWHPATYTESVLILTPICNAAKTLQRYLALLCSLTYPRHLVHVALGEDSSTDTTWLEAQRMIGQLQRHIAEISLYRLSQSLPRKVFSHRHDASYQLKRRKHLAQARNELLIRALGDHDWVLWIDSDVDYVPPDLVQHLLSAERDVVVPTCMYFDETGKMDVYDKNTWQETDQSVAFLKKQESDFLMLEGYGYRSRLYLTNLQAEGVVVAVDGVGGCTLLVRGSSHRSGLVFPAFVLDHHIETEGLGKMAKKMGFSLAGLPHVKVFHG